MRQPRQTASLLTLAGLVAGLILATTPGNATPTAAIRRIAGAVVPSQYVVVLDDVAAADVSAVANDLARRHGGRLGFVYRSALRGFSVSVGALGALAIASDPRVSYVEEDGVAKLVATQTGPPWGLDRIDQRDLPLNSTYSYNATGSGVRAYIIDTGIRTTHADFGGRASSGFDAIDGGAADDCNGHGTHVAGTIGGSTYGVAKQVSLVAVRVLDCGGSGSNSQVIAGVDWVKNNAVKPAVANMSLGGGANTALDTAVRNAINSGVTFGIAAGNGNILGMAQDACGTSPARVAEAITVGATGTNDAKASFSNYGTCLDIFAPGVNTLSSWNTSDSSTNTISGTSMATPHVVGVAATYLQTAPNAAPSAVASALTTNATNGKVTSPGSGSPNKLLYSAFVGGGGGNNPPVANFTSSCTGLSCNFTDTSTDSDGTIASRSWNFGDGGTSTATNPSHTYASPGGTFTVTLSVTDNGGASNSTSKTVTVSSGGGGGDPDPSTPTLTSGVARSDTNGGVGTWKYYKIQVPAGKAQLKVDLAGTASCPLFGSCNPDLDVFVRKGVKPTTATYNCKSDGSTANESCTVANPGADWWYVGVYVYSGSSSINYTIKATVS
jgi:subtilisin family serine protease